MAKVKIDFGAEIDTLNKDELDDSLAGQQKTLAEIQEAVAVRGIKYMRLPLMYGTAASGTVHIGGALASGGGNATGAVSYPHSGYIWTVMRIGVSGLATGTAPDQLAIYRGGDEASGANYIGQISGNTPFLQFSKMQFLVKEGERIQLLSIGSLTSTAQIIVNGDVIEAPEEMLGKLSIG